MTQGIPALSTSTNNGISITTVIFVNLTLKFKSATVSKFELVTAEKEIIPCEVLSKFACMDFCFCIVWFDTSSIKTEFAVKSGSKMPRILLISSNLSSYVTDLDKMSDTKVFLVHPTWTKWLYLGNKTRHWKCIFLSDFCLYHRSKFLPLFRVHCERVHNCSFHLKVWNASYISFFLCTYSFLNPIPPV